MDLFGCSPLLVWLELVVVLLRVERSLEARADRSRGSTGASSASGVAGTGSHAQPSARAADHTANTNVSMAIEPHAARAAGPLPTTLVTNASVQVHTLINSQSRATRLGM